MLTHPAGAQPPAPQPPLLTDAERAARLRYMARIATGLLIGMALLFLATELWQQQLPTWVRFVNAFAEAAMVGALADWFAVTALFRRPLGLPIPHTAIIPEKKERIGMSLGRFVQTNFLSAEVLSQRLEKLSVSDRAQQWLAESENVRLLSQKLTSSLPGLMQMLHEAQVQDALAKTVDTQLRRLEVAPLLSQLLTVVTSKGKHQDVLDELLKLGEKAFANNKRLIRERLKKESPWYVPGFIDNQVYNRIVTGVEQTLQEVNARPDHPLRDQFSLLLDDFIEELKHSETLRLRLEQAKTNLLDSPEASTYLQNLWEGIRRKLEEDVQAENSVIRQQVEDALQKLAQRLLDDPELRQRLDDFARSTLIAIAESQRDSIGQLISDTVARWDTRTLTEKLELQVGRDLQFIRINGTLVGGAVGLLLYLLKGVI